MDCWGTCFIPDDFWVYNNKINWANWIITDILVLPGIKVKPQMCSHECRTRFLKLLLPSCWPKPKLHRMPNKNPTPDLHAAFGVGKSGRGSTEGVETLPIEALVGGGTRDPTKSAPQWCSHNLAIPLIIWCPREPTSPVLTVRWDQYQIS